MHTAGGGTSVHGQCLEASIVSANQKNLRVLLLSIFFDFFALGLILPVLPLMAEQQGASATKIGALFACYSVAQLLAAPLIGRASDSFGRRPVLLFSLSGSLIAAIVLFWAASLPAFFLARLLAGASNACVATAQAAVADLVDHAHRTRALALVGAAIGGGLVFGPACGGWLTPDHFPRGACAFAVVIAALNLLMVRTCLVETNSKPSNTARADRRSTPAKPSPAPLIFIGVVLHFAAFSAMESVFAIFNARVFAWGAQETGSALALAGLAAMATQVFAVAHCVRAFGKSRTCLLGLTVLALSLVGMGAVRHLPGFVEGHNPIIFLGSSAQLWFMLACIGVAVGNAFVLPTIVALVLNNVAADARGRTMGTKEACAAAGRLLGSILGGASFDRLDPSAALYLGGLFAALAAVFVLRHGRHPAARSGAGV